MTFFKRFNDSKRFLDRSQYLNLLESNKISAVQDRGKNQLITEL